MDDEPDALWRPGTGVEAEAPTASAAAVGDVVIAPERNPARAVRVAVPVVIALLTAFVVFVVTRDEGDITELDAPSSEAAVAEPEPFAGADERRLPETAPLLWQNEVAGVIASEDSTVVVDGRDVVVGIFDVDPDVPADDDVRSVMLGVDAGTGEERWRTDLTSTAGSFSLLGVLDDTVVLELLDTQNRSVVGFDVETGEQRWELVTGDPGVHVILEGSSVITRVSFTVNARLTFIDPETGAEVGRVPGRVIATDFVGRWYVRNDQRISLVDLSDGYTDPVDVGVLGVSDSVAATVVDEQIVVIDGEGLARNASDATLSPLAITLSEGVAAPSGIRRLSPMGDSMFAFAGADAFFGADLSGDDVEVAWSVDGGVISTATTDRGLVFVVGAEGDLERRVIDGTNGEMVTAVELANGAAGELVTVGNGFVVKRRADLGFERVGLDLDGSEIWSLIGDGPIAVGDRIVVSFGPGEAGVNLVAFGE